jgi:hypothetical protein
MERQCMVPRLGLRCFPFAARRMEDSALYASPSLTVGEIDAEAGDPVKASLRAASGC